MNPDRLSQGHHRPLHLPRPRQAERTGVLFSRDGLAAALSRFKSAVKLGEVKLEIQVFEVVECSSFSASQSQTSEVKSFTNWTRLLTVLSA